jgi:hypothetical protein
MRGIEIVNTLQQYRKLTAPTDAYPSWFNLLQSLGVRCYSQKCISRNWTYKTLIKMTRIQSSMATVLAVWGMLVLPMLPIVAGQCTATKSNQKMASGYTSNVLITGLKSPRGIVFDSEGALLVAEQQGGSIRRLTLKDDGTNVCVDSNKVLIADGGVSEPNNVIPLDHCG